jgi:esterase
VDSRLPPLLFLHGFACDPSTWCEQQEYFRACSTVMAPALPFHGPQPTPATPTVEGMADAIAERVRRDRAHPVVIGHSLGGMVGLQIALRSPEIVRALVLVDAFPSLALNSTVLPELHASTTPVDIRDRATAMMTVGWMLMGEAMRARLWESIRAMDVTARLGEIRAPVLGIYGGRGRYGAEQTEELKHALSLDRVSRCRVVIIPGAGHFVHWEQPGQINRGIEEFVGGLPFSLAASRSPSV